jgi:hypothetical protein
LIQVSQHCGWVEGSKESQYLRNPLFIVTLRFAVARCIAFQLNWTCRDQFDEL